MYFDPDWIFSEKPDKHQYPNITGLMPDLIKPKKVKRPEQALLNSLSDVFKPHQPLQPPTTVPEITFPMLKKYPWRETSPMVNSALSEIGYLPETEPTQDRLQRFQEQQRNAQAQLERKKWVKGFLDKINPAENKYLGMIPTYNKGKIYSNGGFEWDQTDYMTLTDNKYNLLNNLKIDPAVIDEINKFADYGQLDPQKRLKLMAISASEGEFGRTRDLFGVNDIHNDFGSYDSKSMSDWERKTLDSYYTGDVYHDYWGYLDRKTKGMTDLEGMNRNYKIDKKINPKGETYTERVARYEEILKSNPSFMERAFGKNWHTIFNDPIPDNSRQVTHL